MTKDEIQELLLEQDRLLRILRVGAIAHLCRTGLNRSQARKIWLYTVLKESFVMEEFLNIPHTVDLSKLLEEIVDGE